MKGHPSVSWPGLDELPVLSSSSGCWTRHQWWGQRSWVPWASHHATRRTVSLSTASGRLPWTCLRSDRAYPAHQDELRRGPERNLQGTPQSSYWLWCAVIETKGRQFDKFVVIGGIVSCNDNLKPWSRRVVRLLGRRTPSFSTES